MVANITTGKDVYGALAYNQEKVDRGDGKVLLTHIVREPADGRFNVAATAEDLLRWMPSHYRTEKPVVHVSLNPAPEDRLDDGQLAEIAGAYMERMGWGGQPYIVFKHTDIGREHIHIVSVQVAQGRFLGGTVLFYVLGKLFGYTETFSQPFFIFMMGVISVFIPISALSLIFYVVIFLELLHVSLEVTLFFALVVVLYFLVYQRVFPETRIYLMMVPIFFYFQLPACLPIFVGMFCGIAGLPAILMGTVIYYLSNILQQTMNQLASGSAHGKVYSLIAARAIDNKDLLLYFVVFCLVTALVTAIRKRGVAHGWNISILAGGVVYLICMFIGGYLVNNEINITSQIGTIIGSIAIALIIQFLYNVIDYTREETFEFEDEEYYYYVRAIPKVTVEEEEFNVTQITVPSHRFSLKRKEHKQEHKEQDKEKGEEI